MKKEVIKIHVDQTHLRNEMHFEHLKNNKAAIFKDKTKYSRKKKHKKVDLE